MRRFSALTGLATLTLFLASSGWAGYGQGQNAKGQLAFVLRGGAGIPVFDLRTLNIYGQKTGAAFGAQGEYFVKDGLAVGVDVGYTVFSKRTEDNLPRSAVRPWHFLAHLKYYLPVGGKIGPYLEYGAGANHFTFSENVKSQTKFALLAGAGLDIAVRPDFALVLGGTFDYAIFGKQARDVRSQQVGWFSLLGGVRFTFAAE